MARMNVTHRGITYTVRTESDVIALCWLLKQLDRLAMDERAA
jgi:hypothetical protein